MDTKQPTGLMRGVRPAGPNLLVVRTDSAAAQKKLMSKFERAGRNAS